MKLINLKGKEKAQTEVLSYILVIMIIVIVVAIIMAGLIPAIEKQQSKQKFNTSKNYIDEIQAKAIEVLGSPIDSTVMLTLNLEGLYLNIDEDLNKIEIFHIMYGNYYKNLLRQEDGSKYTYRDRQKLFTGIEFENVDIIRDHFIQNKTINLYFTKIDKNKLKIHTDVVDRTPWYDSSWSYRKEIFIDDNKVISDLDNFPVLISLSDSDLNSYSKSDGSDILFTLGDGTTKLKKEVESYSDGNLVAWVKVPELDANNNTLIYMYYGNSSANEADSNKVWDSNYVMVQHLNESVENDVLGFIDSTRHNNDGTAKNFNDTSKSTTDVDGFIGGAVRFDGDDENDDYIDVTSVNDNLLGASGTISAWAYPVEDGSNRYIFQAVGSGTNIFYIKYTSNIFSVSRGNPIITVNINSNTDYNTWHYTTLTWNDTNLYGYLNGNYIGTAEYTNTSTYGGSSRIGAFGSGNTFPGIIDEVKISKNLRSASWIETEYNNMNSPNTFYTVGEQEIND